MGCKKHTNCGNKEMVWLPYVYQDRDRGLMPHIYCTKCGLVKSASSNKPRRLGYYINVIAALGKDVKIAKVQIRLISQELEKQGIDDIYSMDRCCQEKLFIEAVKKYVNVSEQIIRKYL